MTGTVRPGRRRVLGVGGAVAVLGAGGTWLAGCDRRSAGAASMAAWRASWGGGWVGADAARGHRLRPAAASSAAASSAAAPDAAARPSAAAWQGLAAREVDVVVVGGGVAGLGAARTLLEAGVADTHVLELEDAAGGNARGHAMGGMRCPLGAHYLPLPGPHAHEVTALLDALGVRRRDLSGRLAWDETMLCHAPQERVWVGGGWREGLLPPVDALPAAERAPTADAYRAFARRVAEVMRETARDGRAGFAVPTAAAGWSAALDRLDAVTFAAWLDGAGLVAPALRRYLDYCCLDDYGATSRHVSAWAGLHYFASRHGFHAPGEAAGEDGTGDDDDAVLTWPEGNAWLTARMAAPLGADRLHSARVVVAVETTGDRVQVDAWNARSARPERWRARQVVLAVPLFVAARLVARPGEALREAARAQPHAPWFVCNLQLDGPLQDRPGAPPSWDNVIDGSRTLGYVDAMHQSLRSSPGPTVLTAYWALGGDGPQPLVDARRRLLADDGPAWAAPVVEELATVHPDLPERIVRIDCMRYGHAMAVPAPGLRSSAALAALAAPQGRLHHAHADLAGYSVFEEALHHGVRAGRDVVRALRA